MGALATELTFHRNDYHITRDFASAYLVRVVDRKQLHCNGMSVFTIGCDMIALNLYCHIYRVCHSDPPILHDMKLSMSKIYLSTFPITLD
jgi:hypothetical protein